MSADDQRSTLDVGKILAAIPNLTQFFNAVIGSVSDPNSQPTTTNSGNSSSTTQSNVPNGVTDDDGRGRDDGTRPVVPEDKCRSLFNQVEKLHRDLKHAERALQRLVSLEESVGSLFGSLVGQSRELEGLLKATTTALDNGQGLDASKLQNKEVKEKFRSLSDIVTQLKSQIPSMYPVSNQGFPHNIGKVPHFNPYYIVGGNEMADMRDRVLACGYFRNLLKDYESAFESLSSQAKPCLLCFSVFPENMVVRKRLLVYWWIGEGLIDPQKPGEKTVDDVLRELIEKGFVEPVVKKRRVVGFRLDTLVRFAVIRISEEKEFLCFDEMGVPTEKVSRSFRVCLATKESEEPSRLRLISAEGTEVDKLQTLFNVNDPYPDFKAEWFSKLRNLLVLHLGSLQDSAEHHIEVEDTDFLKGLKNIKRLKYLSLQGISRIVEIPSSICSLSSLRVLDLSSCHNMELLPKSMGTLKLLTHLDISGCYLLDHIPKELNLLSELQVLKGFIIGDSGIGDACLLEDLTKLQKLKKLSITTSREDFPRENELDVLQGFVSLKNLTITWAVKLSKVKTKKHSVPGEIPAKSSHATTVKSAGKGHSKKKGENPVPATEASQKASAAWRRALRELRRKKLEKLELQCFPGSMPPAWLCEGRLKPQKKLYISGGNLQSLGPVEGESVEWDVKILRLKFLSELRMDWGELKKSFPKLIYLEKIKCPKLTFFPCDQSGVWINKALEDKDLKDLELAWSLLWRRID